MAQERKKPKIFVVFLFLLVYFAIAARPIPRETVLVPKWLGSLESDLLIPMSGSEQAVSLSQEKLLPFILGERFGYVDSAGRFSVNKVKKGEIYLGENQWTEYEAVPEKINIMNISEEIEISINDPRGYPVLLDGRVFIFGNDQNVLSEIDSKGNILWTYEFGAPLTCIDAAAGLVLTGSIDGVVEIIDSEGKRIFFFEPGGSRYSVILGCALSRNGLQAGVISGIEDQRFLMLERYGQTGSEYRVIYHEFLEGSFRRPVYITFIDQDRRVVFERAEGIGCYNIKSREGLKIPLPGTITVIENSGDDGFFFIICSCPDEVSGNHKELVGIEFSQKRRIGFADYRRNVAFLRAPFRSEDVFLGRNGSMIIAGGGSKLISFELEKK